ncbi:glycosyltransferase family 2 protein [Lacinutrix sp. C3R15]|uniref:glycosyltransferase family 2 protein n=1 Tax=Flavobacteriaceae TaxID=49546 RepID=UPI001C093C60|nr:MULTISPECIES: glycosyltransferase family 2 protein [Flavobacteriaceae]MBU2939565.1 glycosyltransferase family 2 protein [Lacinutrix sp. C3R15]MDO6622879.1 glycosyltransferase family 2 protein [Oceanihabitans sp. 1_MG-2023]
MPEQPLVSIIIPTYNRAHLIGETLDSILAQSYTNWECIVVDDGSTDGTATVMDTYLKKDSRFQYHVRPNTHLPGGNGARNFGFKKSKGDYVQWFDSDDVMCATLIEHQLQSLVVHNLPISICLLDRYNEDLTELKKTTKKHTIRYSIYCDFALRIFKANLQTSFFKRDIAKKYTFNESLKKSQEVAFLQRIFREHEECIYLLNEVLVKIRRHSGSITTNYTLETLKSILDVKLLLIDEFPENQPVEVLEKLKFHFLDKLKIAFVNKRTSIFNGYLLKFTYIKWYDYLYLTILYVFHFMFNKGLFSYEQRIKKMYSNR